MGDVNRQTASRYRAGARVFSGKALLVGALCLLIPVLSVADSAALDETDLVGTWFDDKKREYRITNFDKGWIGLGVPSRIALSPKDATFCIRAYVGEFKQNRMILTCVPEDITEMNRNIPDSVRQQILDKGYEWRAELVASNVNGQIILQLNLLNPQITAKENDPKKRYQLIDDKTKYVSVSKQRLQRGTLHLKINCFPEKCGYW